MHYVHPVHPVLHALVRYIGEMPGDVSDYAASSNSRSPFSLTPDPAFYFRSRSHGRVFDAVSLAITRRESLMLVVGDLGVGKTTLCRTLIDLQGRWPVALVGNALLSLKTCCG